MTDLQAIADRVEIGALPGEYTDAVMMRDYDRVSTTGRAYVSELIRLRDGTSQLNYAIYHDRYLRTPDGWRFTERVYEIRYLDATPLTGSAPPRPDGV